ncbi:MAG: ATP-binding cassette domain-containing protein [Gammaproteobacteria bacterium]|nr:ATP-binding cassette domain-containing protein [Gammaproteobacteria bacterium]
MNAVEFQGVGKRFDEWVFRDVDLALPNERTTALVGPSGCGKTTLLQLVNAVQRPDQGVVEVFGEPVPETGLVPFRRRFGYAVQGAGLFPHMTIADNVGLVARLEGWSPDAIRARRRELLDIVGLSEALDGRYPHQLSGGQQQRVGLCRALMLKPRMLLLDEPFAGVDPITRADLYPEFEQLRDHEEVTTLLVTHDVAEAQRLADHLVVMGGGGVVQAGPIDEVIAAPRNAFVRDLLASAL